MIPTMRSAVAKLAVFVAAIAVIAFGGWKLGLASQALVDGPFAPPLHVRG
jgi:hypothetical protein